MQETAMPAAPPALVDAPQQIALAGFAPASARAGSRFVVEWRLRNLGAAPLAVNVYVRTPRLVVERFTCKHARTAAGRTHGSAIVSLAGDAETRLVLLVGAPEPGMTRLRADAVYDGGDVSSVLPLEIVAGS